MKTTMTDVIKDEYKEWKAGDLVYISSGTGSGKSHFVQKVLSEYAKQNSETILYLVSRAKLKDQIEDELKREGITNITVMMYQKLGTICNYHYHNSLIYGYDYVVCDESHYFTNDSSFNNYTEITLDNIMSYKHTVTLFLSATGELLIKYLEKFYNERKIREYSLEQDFNIVKKLEAYETDEELEARIEYLYQNKIKTMIFVQSDQLAYQIAIKYKENSTFVCGVKSKYKKYMNKKKIEIMLEEKKFDTLFLVATSALDVGVNIFDEEVKHIIIDMLDTDTFIQCLGRKRFTETEERSINVLFRIYSNRQLGGLISKESIRVAQGKSFYKSNAFGNDYLKGKVNSVSNIFYIDSDYNHKVNKLKYIKANQNLSRYREYVREPRGHLKAVKSLLNYHQKVIIHNTVKETEEKELEQARERILRKNTNIKYLNKEAKAILKKLALKNNKTNKIIKDIEIANIKFGELGLPYRFEKSREYSIHPDGKSKQARFYTLIELRQNEQ